MKPIGISIVVLLSILTMSSKSYAHDKPPVLKGPYVGQNPPGSTPKVFAPTGLSTEHRDCSGFFTPDMKEFYLLGKATKMENGR